MKYLAILLLSGCAIFPPDYKWVRTTAAPSTSYVWLVKSPSQMGKFCGSPGKTDIAGCAVQIQESGKCYIFSIYDEETAKRVFAGGGDDAPMLREHELKHCAGWVHQQRGRT